MPEKIVPDSQIRHYWIHDSCEEKDNCWVHPNWYEENGTPVCICGDDMNYSHTTIETQN